MIATWHDRKIDPSDDWAEEIDVNLERADIILLLISADFINSEYCYQIEGQRALERHNNGEAKTIPVIIRPCKWELAEFSKLQGLPRDGKPVAKFGDRDEAWRQVADGIEKVASELLKRPE